MKYKVIKFGASWCMPCRVLEQQLKSFNKCDIIKYDVDEVDEKILVDNKIRGVPVVMIVDEKNNEIKRWTGIFNVKELEKKLDELENG